MAHVSQRTVPSRPHPHHGELGTAYLPFPSRAVYSGTAPPRPPPRPPLVQPASPSPPSSDPLKESANEKRPPKITTDHSLRNRLTYLGMKLNEFRQELTPLLKRIDEKQMEIKSLSDQAKQIRARINSLSDEQKSLMRRVRVQNAPSRPVAESSTEVCTEEEIFRCANGALPYNKLHTNKSNEEVKLYCCRAATNASRLGEYMQAMNKDLPTPLHDTKQVGVLRDLLESGTDGKESAQRNLKWFQQVHQEAADKSVKIKFVKKETENSRCESNRSIANTSIRTRIHEAIGELLKTEKLREIVTRLKSNPTDDDFRQFWDSIKNGLPDELTTSTLHRAYYCEYVGPVLRNLLLEKSRSIPWVQKYLEWARKNLSSDQLHYEWAYIDRFMKTSDKVKELTRSPRTEERGAAPMSSMTPTSPTSVVSALH